MDKLNRVIFLVQRFFSIWRNEGLDAALAITKARLIAKIPSSAVENQAATTIQPGYRDVYGHYLLSSERKKPPEYIDLTEENDDLNDLPVKLIAFYLPQYHPIPENDLWWGRGFTEWTNVSKAVPNFVGHYQPRFPGELGYYDLRIPEVLRRQVELARLHGLYGFCFHYYWFNGQRLLEKPLEMFINDPIIDFPFCVCWANENWSCKWDGQDEDVLIAQEHSFECDKAIIHDLVKLFSDPRYIRINNRPIFIVYRANILKDVQDTVEYWRKYSIENGTGNPYIIEAQTGGFVDPRKIGLDAVVEFPPNSVPEIPEITKQLSILNPFFKGIVINYEQVAEVMLNKEIPEYRLFKTVIPSWDNTPRLQNSSLIFANSNPSFYQSWLSATLSYSIRNGSGDDNLVFINAWNEWAESAYLEPDKRFGYGYLQATRNALQSVQKEKPARQLTAGIPEFLNFNRQNDTALVIHLFYFEMWEEIKNYLSNLEDKFDLFISIPDGINNFEHSILDDYPTAKIIQWENYGRDIAPFIAIYSNINRLGYKYVCKIHTKKSEYIGETLNWRKELLDELLGSQQIIRDIKQHLDEPGIGMIGPKNNLISTRSYMGGNLEIIQGLASQLGKMYRGEPFLFIAGSMYWFKPAAISKILELNLSERDFPVEKGQRDATLAHAMERFICFLALNSGFQVIQTGTFNSELATEFAYAKPLQHTNNNT